MEQQAVANSNLKCPKCNSDSKRFGKHRNGLQRYRCLSCRKTFTEDHEPAFRIADYLNDPRGVMAIQLLVEGCSIRTAERITGLHRDAIMQLLVIAGQRCEALMYHMIQNVPSRNVQADEIWSFIGKKEKNKGPEEAHEDSLGDCYTWVAIDRYTKLVLCFVVGRRTQACAMDLMMQLRRATDPNTRFQLTTDGFPAYIPAVDEFLMDRCDYGQIVKTYAQPQDNERRYSPAECVGCKKVIISGNPSKRQISTSHIERQNLTMRMNIRKRLVNHRRPGVEDMVVTAGFAVQA